MVARQIIQTGASVNDQADIAEQAIKGCQKFPFLVRDTPGMRSVEWSFRTDGYLPSCDEGWFFWRLDRCAGLQPRQNGPAYFGGLPGLSE
jgi:hypothetical protein